MFGSDWPFPMGLQDPHRQPATVSPALKRKLCCYVYDGTPADLPYSSYKMYGLGPFTHDDPKDRPGEVFVTTNTLHFSADQVPYLLLPIIPIA